MARDRSDMFDPGSPEPPEGPYFDELRVLRGTDELHKRSGNGWAPLLVVGTAVSVRAFGAVGDNTTNDTAAIQAAIDATHNAGGGSVFVPEGIFRANVVLRPNVYLVGTGWKSILKSVAGSDKPVIGSPLQAYPTDQVWEELYHCGVSTLRVDGDARSGSTGRGIDLVNSNGDAYWSIGGHYAPDSWNDPAPILDRVFVFDTGGDGIRLGKNMRGAHLSDSFVFRSRRTGLRVDATDIRVTALQVGVCGDGVVLTRGNNAFANCKSWWNVGTADDWEGGPIDYVGGGDGWRLESPPSMVQLTGCESQDNYGAGLSIGNAQSVVAKGFVCGGDTFAGLYLWGTTARCDLDVMGVWADRVQLDRLVRINGAGVVDNVIRAHDHPTRSRTAGFKALVLENGARADNNALIGRPFDTAEDAVAANNPVHRLNQVNSWVPYGSGLQGLGVRQIAEDKVRVSGVIKSGSNAVVGNVQGRLRPSQNRYVNGGMQADASFGTWTPRGVSVASNGDMSVLGTGVTGAAFLALDFEYSL